MANEIKTEAQTQKTEGQSSILSKLRGFFQKSQTNPGEQKNQRLTKAFHFTRKESVLSVLVALIVVGGAIYYGKVVLDKYAEINSQTESLKWISTYGITPNKGTLSPYSEGEESLKTIQGMISIHNNIEKEIEENEIIKNQQKSYYEVLLQNIYLPSLNVWKDPYTKNFNMGILGQKYLEHDKFQDLYLIQYWSDFAKYVGNDADYNTIDNITIGEKVIVDENPQYFYTPITIKFSSPNKRSFLLLVNKLSTTSNQRNIVLLNEFFFYLLKAIRENKEGVINDLMEEYWDEFASSSSWDLGSNLSELTGTDRAIYEDRVIGYNLYHWIMDDGVLSKGTDLIDDDVIVKTIRRSALCKEGEADQKCFYNFREKYRNLPYLAYQVGLERVENQGDRTKGLLEFLQDLPSAIAITDFSFERYSDSSFLNNKEEEYEGEFTFNAYGRNILDSELEEASLMLGKLCFGNATDQQLSPDLALKRVSEAIAGKGLYQNVSSLGELQLVFESVQEDYEEMSNYDKMIKLFEIRRMMNDANLCNK